MEVTIEVTYTAQHMTDLKFFDNLSRTYFVFSLILYVANG